MQHAIERVERPGESQEALDGKKICLVGWVNMPQQTMISWAQKRKGKNERAKQMKTKTIQ